MDRKNIERDFGWALEKALQLAKQTDANYCLVHSLNLKLIRYPFLLAAVYSNCGLRFPGAPFQFCKCATGEPAEFGRRGGEFFGVIGAARLECGEPAAEAGEFIRRQLGNSFGDFFDFHAAQYITAET